MKTTRTWTGMATVMVVPALAAIAVAGGGRYGTAAGGGGPELEVDINDPACNAAGPVFCQIQDAINNAVPGAEIEVEDGVYMPVNIPAGLDGLEIEAEEDGAIIDGGGVNDAVLIASANVSISGFEIRNAANGVNLGADGAEVEGCTIHMCTNIGIFVGANGCEIEGNELFDCGSAPFGAGAGIAIVNGMNNEVSDNDIHDNPGVITSGIGVVGSNNNEICDNECEANGLDGITVVDSDNNEIEGNDCENNGFDGIFLDGTSDNNELEENSAEENAVTGLRDQGGMNSWEENESCENMVDGLAVQSNMSTFCDNECEGNMVDGIFGSAASMMNVIEDNDAENNGGFGINDDSVGGGTQGTANFYDDNDCDDNGAGDSDPAGLCD